MTLPLLVMGAAIWTALNHFPTIGAAYVGLFRALAAALGEPV